MKQTFSKKWNEKFEKSTRRNNMEWWIDKISFWLEYRQLISVIEIDKLWKWRVNNWEIIQIYIIIITEFFLEYIFVIDGSYEFLKNSGTSLLIQTRKRKQLIRILISMCYELTANVEWSHFFIQVSERKVWNDNYIVLEKDLIFVRLRQLAKKIVRRRRCRAHTGRFDPNRGLTAQFWLTDGLLWTFGFAIFVSHSSRRTDTFRKCSNNLSLFFEVKVLLFRILGNFRVDCQPAINLI